MAAQSGPAPVVEVFRARPAALASCAPLLDASESARIERLLRPEDRARVATGRALLRLVVAGRLGCDPAAVTFTYRCAVCGGAHGKPTPRVADGAVPVHTSVSYSGSVVLVAVADVPVGLDVERCARTGFAGFDKTALTAEEHADLAAVEPERRAGVRAALWSAKEAILKINGLGLSVSPTTVHVGRQGQPGVVTVDAAIARSGVVGLAAVPVDDSYRARVACEGALVPTVVVRESPLEGRQAPFEQPGFEQFSSGATGGLLDVGEEP